MADTERYSFIFVAEANGGYTVSVVGLPKIRAFGSTEKEAQERAVEALERHLAEQAGDDRGNRTDPADLRVTLSNERTTS